MAKTLSAFEKAFVAARDKGLKEFDYKGKMYHTRRADDKPASKDHGPGKRKPGSKSVMDKRADYDKSAKINTKEPKTQSAAKHKSPESPRKDTTKGAKKGSSKTSARLSRGAPSKPKRKPTKYAGSPRSDTTKGAKEGPKGKSRLSRARSASRKKTLMARVTKLPKKRGLKGIY